MAGTLADDSFLPWKRCMHCNDPIRSTTDVCFLPCLHVLCADSCVNNFITECNNQADGEPVLRCKTCTKIVPSVNYLNGRVWFKQFLPDKPKLENFILKCNYCILDLPAAFCCIECRRTMCRECSEYHKIETVGHGHRQVAIPETLPEERYRKFVNLRNTCNVHNKKDFLQFCFSCQRKLCGTCHEHHDSSHSISSIAEDIAKAHKGLLLLGAFKDVAQGQASKLQDRLSSLEQIEFSAFEKGMRHTAGRLTEEIKRRFETYTIEARSTFELSKLHIQRKIDFFLYVAYDVTRLKTVWEYVKEKKDDIGVINIARTSKPWMDNLIKLQLSEEVDASDEASDLIGTHFLRSLKGVCRLVAKERLRMRPVKSCSGSRLHHEFYKCKHQICSKRRYRRNPNTPGISSHALVIDPSLPVMGLRSAKLGSRNRRRSSGALHRQ